MLFEGFCKCMRTLAIAGFDRGYFQSSVGAPKPSPASGRPWEARDFQEKGPGEKKRKIERK